MRRREFITLLGGAAAGCSLEVHAQQPGRVRRLPHVGILNYAAAQDSLVDEFHSGLRELGRVEGQTLSITYRAADGQLGPVRKLLNRLAVFGCAEDSLVC